MPDAEPNDRIEVTVMDGERTVATAVALPGVAAEAAMPADMKLWSPDSPFLYDLRVTLKSGKETVDEVKSYAAMRKFSTARDADGIVRLQLQ